jgi:hypothetical protein
MCERIQKIGRKGHGITMFAGGYPGEYTAENPASMRVMNHSGYQGYHLYIKDYYISRVWNTRSIRCSEMHVTPLGSLDPLYPRYPASQVDVQLKRPQVDPS